MKSITEIVPVKWHEKIEDIIQNQILPEGYSDLFEIEYQKKDKSILPVEVRLFR
jgi:two-component system cell cycle sensor histidine kinase/response regulator CckA